MQVYDHHHFYLSFNNNISNQSRSSPLITASMAHTALNMGGERQGADTVGQGRIFDTNAFGPSAATASAGGDGTLPVWSSGASQYRLPPSEVLKGVANRFVHSTGYIYLYGSMALASLFTVVLSLMTECPGTLFYAIELVVNTVLVVEVGVRFVAFGRVSSKMTMS